MFVPIHFDTVSLFPAVIIEKLIGVTLKRLGRFRRQNGVAPEWALN